MVESERKEANPQVEKAKIQTDGNIKSEVKSPRPALPSPYKNV